MAGWIRTYSGKRFNVFEPRTEDVDIVDIAHALSFTCRFSGHTTQFYSVAEHCLNMCALLPDDLKIYGLLHDAAEAYLTDVPTPIKKQMPDIHILESKVMQVVAVKFKLQYQYFLCREIKDMDWALCVAEAKQFLSEGIKGWTAVLPQKDIRRLPFPPMAMSSVEEQFLFNFYRLMEARK